MSEIVKKKENSGAFVNFIIDKCHASTGAAAALKRADNPVTEHQCWEYLSSFVDLEKAYRRLPYAAIAAAIARSKASSNGGFGIGSAIASCYSDGNKNDQAKAKLRRLLACGSVEDVCQILRPLFSLIDAKAGIKLNYAQLLSDILKFYWDSDYVKAKWAQDFYGCMPEEAVA